ncbi:MAG: sigma-70 family RNA polymerase sigma factor [Actinobacteria bacterium]|nr:sigma-70 family RNA polymerase sigma factor [Actinomycetota bacterium]
MALEGVDDAELLRRAALGEDAAFTALMAKHEGRIFSLALKMTGDRSDALDATQDTFLSAFRQASRFRGESAFSTWLYRIGINACKDLLKKKGRLPQPSETEDLEQAAPAIRSKTEDVDLRLDISSALAHLSEDYRQAVVMHDIGGIPYDDIAEATGVAIGTVKSRISRGRRQLAEILEHPGGPGASKERHE